MMRRLVTGVSRDERGRIELLHGADDADWSPVTAREAAAGIRADMYTYAAEGIGGPADIHDFKGVWVRSDADESPGNNLDNFMPLSPTATGTGRYRLVTTASAAAVSKMTRAMHASGLMLNDWSTVTSGWDVRVRLGVPGLIADGDSVIIRRRAWCTVVSAQGTGEEFCAVATVATRVRVTSVVQQGEARMKLEFSAAPQPIVCETSLSSAHEQALTAALAHFLDNPAPGTWRLPLVGLLANMKQIDFELDAAGTVRLGASGAKFAGPAFTHSTPPWEWTVAISRPAVAELLAAAVRSELGALPAPFGTARGVDVGDGAELTYLSFDLRQGSLVVVGRLRRAGPPVVTALFHASFSLELSSAGELVTTLRETTVDVQEWYADVADFFSGGAITRAVEGALRESLSSLSTGAMEGVLDTEFLERLLAGGTTVPVGMRAVPRRLWVERGAVCLGGVLESEAPTGAATLAHVRESVTAELSAFPGADIATIVWDVDGEVTEQSFQNISLRMRLPAADAERHVTVHITTDDGVVYTDSVTVPASP